MLDKFKRGLLASGACLMLTEPARAFSLNDSSLSSIFLISAGIFSVGFAFIAGVMLSREKRALQKTLSQSENQRSQTAERLQDIENLLLSERQIRLIWDKAGDKPRLFGDTTALFPKLTARDFMQFDQWIAPSEIGDFRQKIGAFLQNGAGFHISLKTPEGVSFEAEAVASGASAMLVIKPLSNFQQQINDKEQILSENRDSLLAMEHFLDTLPHPVWLRDKIGKLRFVNRAFAEAVEQPQTADAILRNMEFLDHSAVEEITRRRVVNESFSGSVNATAKGARRTFDVIDRPFTWGSAGLAVDVTETDKLKRERKGEMLSLRSTFDMLGTAIALFDADKKLIFYNDSYVKLFNLAPAFLDTNPSEGDVLDRMRDQRKIPEESNYRVWKEKFMEVYTSRSSEPVEDFWYLADRSTLRVIRVPNPQGGVTTLFEDQTEKLQLEMKYSSLNRVQNETLENLNEAVAVFAPDGKLSLWNDAFVQIWDLNASLLKTKPHITKINDLCAKSLKQHDALIKVQNMIVSLGESRAPFDLKVELTTEITLEVLAVPLPDGGTLITYRDISQDVEAERLLLERNEALIAADKLKTAFVGHVSYELRTPLTTVMGFTEVLQSISQGMSEQQRDYLAHISTASTELNVVINSILNFAELEAGTLTIEKEPVDVSLLMRQAISSVSSKRQDDKIRLGAKIQGGLTHIHCDGGRILQALHNVLSNAVSFAKVNGEVRITAARDRDNVVFIITDDGPGLDDAIKNHATTPFISSPGNGKHRGLGLGLTISKMLIELHGGTLNLASEQGQGTTVTLTMRA
jgi:signal transduction histidine kinase